MKLNHVSVVREYGVRGREPGYFLRAELESQPGSAWVNQFQFIWLNSPHCKKLCPEIQFSRNDLILKIADGSCIAEALDALRSTIHRVNQFYHSSSLEDLNNLSEKAL